MMQRPMAAAAFLLSVILFGGCGASGPDEERRFEALEVLEAGEGVFRDRFDGPEADHRALESLNFPDAEEAGRIFGEGEAVRFEHPEGFRQAGLMIDFREGSELMARGRFFDGGWSEWAPVEITFREAMIHNGLVVFDAPVTALELRGAKEVRYAYLEFSREVLAPESRVIGPAWKKEFREAPRDGGDDLGEVQQGVAPSDLVISRHEWGAHDPDRICNSVAAPYRMAVHHTAGSNDETDPAARMRAIQNFHINTRGWCDIGYHFVVARTGEIFQGRSRSDRPGAHVADHNIGNVGLCMMGTYSTVSPPEAQQKGIVEMMKWVHRTHGVPLDRESVLGHREHQGAATECPGNLGITYMDELVARAREAVQAEDSRVEFWIETELEDFVAQGSSEGRYDALEGDRFEATIYLSNQSMEPIRGVEVGYSFDGTSLAPQNYRIESDAPAFDLQSWGRNDAEDLSENPASEELGKQGILHLAAFAPGETKRVVFDVEGSTYNFGEEPESGLRAWVRNIDDLYRQNTPQGAPGLNPRGWELSEAIGVDVFSPRQWRFEGPDREDREGWTVAGGDAALFVEEGSLRKEVRRVGAGIISPVWTSVDADVFDEVVLRIDGLRSGQEMELHWRREGESFDPLRSLSFRVSGEERVQTIAVPLGLHEEWSGEITRLMLLFGDLEREESYEVGVDFVYFQDRQGGRTSSSDFGVAHQDPVEVFRGGEMLGARDLGMLLPRAEGSEVAVKGAGCAAAVGERPLRGGELLLLFGIFVVGLRRRRCSPRRHGRGFQSGCRDRRIEG